MRFYFLLICSWITIANAQTNNIEFNKLYPKVEIKKDSSVQYSIKLMKNEYYHFSVIQKGIDVKLILKQGDKTILEKDSPNGAEGPEEFDYVPEKTLQYILLIERLNEDGNPVKGIVSVFIKKLTKLEVVQKEITNKELEAENKKNISTLDIDHFWQAFDSLKYCKTKDDSINIIQSVYLDRGTEGLGAFAMQRQFTAAKFVEQIKRLPKFYASVRKNTYKTKEAEQAVQQVFDKFKELYPNFKPFKVCFAIGLSNTGGTVSNKYVLIGAEVSTSTKEVDLSEWGNNSYKTMLAGDTNLLQRIKEMVAHECVHTQEKYVLDSNAVSCPLLYECMHEGFCDFIGEMVAGSQINKIYQDYGNKHEKELWMQMKNELCNVNPKNWLYNYGTAKERPADLGYYMGYKIAESYYKNAVDKKQAIVDIIEMNDPMLFLEKSKYDKKFK